MQVDVFINKLRDLYLLLVFHSSAVEQKGCVCLSTLLVLESAQLLRWDWPEFSDSGAAVAKVNSANALGSC